MAKDSLLDRVIASRAAEQCADVDLDAREKDNDRIVGPQAVPAKRPVHKCRGCLKMREYTKGYCLKCYSRVRLGRSLEFLDDDED